MTYTPKTYFRFSLRDLWRNKMPRVNEQAVFLLGNQKSGTSAIAALLAMRTRTLLTLDIPHFVVEEQDQLHRNELSLDDYLARHVRAFSSDLIKEPALTFLYEPLRARFSNGAKWVFIVRDPRDTIRSILNRVKKPGNLETLSDVDDIPPAWRRVIWNDWLGLSADQYIESMAHRWNRACDLYRADADRLILLRYEDFLEDKVKAVDHLAEQLGLPGKASIDHLVDQAYQPRGTPTPWQDFFGANLERIESICKTHMQDLSYSTRRPT